MKLSVLTVLLITTFSASGQLAVLSDEQLNNSGASKLNFVENLNEAAKIAESDIQNGTPLLLLQGGIAPIVISTDRNFEKRYNVYFYDYGCIAPDDSIMTAYNIVIFNYLNDKFSKRWTKEIREDVIGFKKWKRSE